MYYSLLRPGMDWEFQASGLTEKFSKSFSVLEKDRSFLLSKSEIKIRKLFPRKILVLAEVNFLKKDKFFYIIYSFQHIFLVFTFIPLSVFNSFQSTSS